MDYVIKEIKGVWKWNFMSSKFSVLGLRIRLSIHSIFNAFDEVCQTFISFMQPLHNIFMVVNQNRLTPLFAPLNEATSHKIIDNPS